MKPIGEFFAKRPEWAALYEGRFIYPKSKGCTLGTDAFTTDAGDGSCEPIGARFSCKSCGALLVPGRNPLDVLKRHQGSCNHGEDTGWKAARKKPRCERGASGELINGNAWRAAEATLAARILQLQRTLISAGIPVPPQQPRFLKYLETIPEGAVGAIARLRNGDVDAPRRTGSASGGHDSDSNGDIGQDGDGDDDGTGQYGGGGADNAGGGADAAGIAIGIGSANGMGTSGTIDATGIGVPDGDEEASSPPPLQIEGVSRSGRVRRAVTRA